MRKRYDILKMRNCLELICKIFVFQNSYKNSIVMMWNMFKKMIKGHRDEI